MDRIGRRADLNGSRRRRIRRGLVGLRLHHRQGRRAAPTASGRQPGRPAGGNGQPEKGRSRRSRVTKPPKGFLLAGHHGSCQCGSPPAADHQGSAHHFVIAGARIRFQMRRDNPARAGPRESLAHFERVEWIVQPDSAPTVTTGAAECAWVGTSDRNSCDSKSPEVRRRIDAWGPPERSRSIKLPSWRCAGCINSNSSLF